MKYKTIYMISVSLELNWRIYLFVKEEERMNTWETSVVCRRAFLKHHSYHRVLLHTHIEFCRVVVVHLVNLKRVQTCLNLLAAIRKLFLLIFLLFFLFKRVQTCLNLFIFFLIVGSNVGHYVWGEIKGIHLVLSHMSWFKMWVAKV